MAIILSRDIVVDEGTCQDYCEEGERTAVTDTKKRVAWDLTLFQELTREDQLSVTLPYLLRSVS